VNPRVQSTKATENITVHPKKKKKSMKINAISSPLKEIAIRLSRQNQVNTTGAL
jgi:hypothetical protein